MFDERQMAEALISRCSFFHESINPAIVVEPIKASFDFPPLPAVSFFLQFRLADVLPIVLASDQTGLDVSFSKLGPELIIVVTLIGPEAFGPSDLASNGDPIYGF